MEFNTSIPHDTLPPLPSYTLRPLPSLLSFISDTHLALALPIVGYWIVSLFFYIIDEYDLCPQYRLHTPAELLKRNRATKWEVFRDVIIQQIIQTIFGLTIAAFDPEQMYGKEDYDVAVWAQRIRLAQRGFPILLSLVGVNSGQLGKRLSTSSPILAGVLAGGRYPFLQQVVTMGGEHVVAPAFADWEILVAKLIYHVGFPAIQFAIAVVIVDTWQYFLHRGMHMNQWLYTTLHSRHHRLYVPYAYGALYNHPIEGFTLDTLGTGIAYLVTGMTPRQSMWFFTASAIKTVDDHCGYALPWDPLQHITSNNAAYHDIHHQSWGIKSNFSQPFLIVWDKMLGTMWKGGDVKLRYEKSRKVADEWWEAQKKLAMSNEANLEPTQSTDSSSEERKELTTSTAALRRSPRKKSLKGLKDRVTGSLPNGVPRVESQQ